MLLYDILNENRNVANIDAIESLCNELAQTAATPAIADWFRKVLRKYLIRDFPEVFPMGMEQLGDNPDLYPAWIVARLNAGEEVVKVQISRAFIEDLHGVRDWMNGQQNTPLMQEPNRLMRVAVPQALDAAQEYHEELRRESDAERTKAMAVAVQGVVPVLEVGAHQWVSLTTDAALEQEGTAMGHCVGKDEQHYKEDVRSGQSQIYSLRDAKGFPHVTVEVHQGRVNQIQGKGNDIPVPRYIPAVIALLNHIEPSQVSGHYIERMGIAAVRRGREMVYLPLADAMAENMLAAEKRTYGDGVTFFQINDKIYLQVEGDSFFNIPRQMVELDSGQFSDLLSQRHWYPQAALRWISHFLQDMGITPKDAGRLHGLRNHNIFYLDGRWGSREDFAETHHYDGIDFLVNPDAIIVTVDGFDIKLANYDHATRTVAPNNVGWGGTFLETDREILWPHRREIVRFLNDQKYRMGLYSKLYGIGLMSNGREFGLIEEMAEDWGTYPLEPEGGSVRFLFAFGSSGVMGDQRLFSEIDGELQEIAEMQHRGLVRVLYRGVMELRDPVVQVLTDHRVKLKNNDSNLSILNIPYAKGDYISPELASNPDQIALHRTPKGQGPDYSVLNDNVARHAGKMSAKAQETVLKIYRPKGDHLVNPNVYASTPRDIAKCLGDKENDWSDYQTVGLSPRIVPLLAIDALGCFTDDGVREKVDALYRKVALQMLSYARKNLKKFIEISDRTKDRTEFGGRDVTPVTVGQMIERIGMIEEFEAMQARLIRAKQPLARRLRKLPQSEERDYLLEYIDNQFRLDGRSFAQWYRWDRHQQAT